jgi:adenine-specific DNA glycosylase
VCPLREDCAAHREGLQEILPELAPRAKTEPVLMGAALVEEKGRILLYRRTRTKLLKDFWEPPIAECTAGESPREAVAREARETYGIALGVGEELARVKHSIMNRRITLHAYGAVLEANPKEGVESDYRWVKRDRIADLPMSSMVRKVLVKTRAEGFEL